MRTCLTTCYQSHFTVVFKAQVVYYNVPCLMVVFVTWFLCCFQSPSRILVPCLTVVFVTWFLCITYIYWADIVFVIELVPFPWLYTWLLNVEHLSSMFLSCCRFISENLHPLKNTTHFLALIQHGINIRLKSIHRFKYLRETDALIYMFDMYMWASYGASCGHHSFETSASFGNR